MGGSDPESTDEQDAKDDEESVLDAEGDEGLHASVPRAAVGELAAHELRLENEGARHDHRFGTREALEDRGHPLRLATQHDRASLERPHRVPLHEHDISTV